MESISARTFVSAIPVSSGLIRFLSKLTIFLANPRIDETDLIVVHTHALGIAARDASERARETPVGNQSVNTQV